jgi:hypothetical protein
MQAWFRYVIVVLDCSFSSSVVFWCLILMKGLAFPSPSIRYINRFETHTCPDQDPMPTSGWAATNSANLNSNMLQEEKSLRFLISFHFQMKEVRSTSILHTSCLFLLHAGFLTCAAFFWFMPHFRLLP